MIAKLASTGFRGARFFGEALGTYFFSPHRIVGPLEVARDPLPAPRLTEQMAKRSQVGSQMTGVFGDPVAARESVSRLQEAGVDELILVMQMGTVPQAIVMESIQTFAEKVMPHFA